MMPIFTAQQLIATLPRQCRATLLQQGDDRTERPLRTLCVDSRFAGADTLFICLCGFRSDGHDFAEAAYRAGCRCFLTCHPLPVTLPDDACVWLVPDTREAQAHLAAAFYGHPASKLTLVGITGTKGKTTTALMSYTLLCRLGVQAGYIGTDGVRYGTYYEATKNTTPDSPELHRILRDMADAGVSTVLMEISSQSVWQKRILGLSFSVGAFTNLSPDHISPTEHPDFDHYLACKHAFLRDYVDGAVLLNADDPYADAMAKQISAPVHRFGIRTDAPLRATALCPAWQKGRPGIAFTCREGAHTTDTYLPMPGEYNVSNALCAVGILSLLGYGTTLTLPLLESISVPGRFELAPAPEDCLCVIDYAHNEVSLRAVLTDLRHYTKGRLICLVGSVGGRTQLRRRPLGEVAATLADLTVFTADNPDFEDPADICREMAQIHIERAQDNYLIIPDRTEAIRHAVSLMHPGDVLLLAGKGSERYQRVRGKELPFSEREILEQAVATLLTV